MLRAITLSNFKINFKEFEINRDYNMEIEFQPKTKDEEIFGHKLQNSIIQFTHGIIDTTISSANYDCVVFYDDEQTGIDMVKNVTFKRKVSYGIKDITPEEPAEMPQMLDADIKRDFRKIPSPSGDSYINIGDDIIEIVSGDTKFTVSKNQITKYSPNVEYDLPNKSSGGLFIEGGIFRYLPKCFIPPFSLPDFLPNVFMVYMIAKKFEVIKNFIDQLEKKDV